MTPETKRLLADLRHHDIRVVAHAGLEAADLIERLTSELADRDAKLAEDTVVMRAHLEQCDGLTAQLEEAKAARKDVETYRAATYGPAEYTTSLAEVIRQAEARGAGRVRALINDMSEDAVAYEASATRAMAISGNYVADDAVHPHRVTFANGRAVWIGEDGFLQVGWATQAEKAKAGR